ncbi:MAG: glyoxalase superfamily protein [Hyphomicrobiaceae bacterium]
MALHSPIPILRSFDEARAKEFYLGFLGFEITFEHRFEPGFPLYMGVRRDACELHLSEHFGDGTPGTYVRIGIDDLDDYCRTLNEKKYGNARPGIQAQPWGRDMSISDPFANKLIFTDIVS